MVIIDTLGSAPPSASFALSDKQLAGALTLVSKALKLPFGFVDFDEVGVSDSESFRARKIPVITIHSVTQEIVSKLHTEEDQLTPIQPGHYQESYRLILADSVSLDQVWPVAEENVD